MNWSMCLLVPFLVGVTGYLTDNLKDKRFILAHGSEATAHNGRKSSGRKSSHPWLQEC